MLPLTHFHNAVRRAEDVEIQRQCRPARTRAHTQVNAALSTLTQHFLASVSKSLETRMCCFSPKSLFQVYYKTNTNAFIFKLIIIRLVVFGFVFIYSS